jgi:ABC-2 type transport system permease protein
MSATATLSLIKQLAIRDLVLRYRSSFLGFFWSLVKPLVLIVLFYFVFEKILGVRQSMAGLPAQMNYGLFLAVGIITWSFLSTALIEGTSSYLNHHHLIARAFFWRPALPLAGVAAHSVHYVLAQAVLVVILGLAGTHTWSGDLLWLIPITLAEVFLASVIVWLLAGFQVFARDTQSLVELALMVGFYGSPIVYPADLALNRLAPWHLSFFYLLNPAAPLLVLRQHLLLWQGQGRLLTESFHGLEIPALLFWMLEVGALLFLATKMNRKLNREIADRL